MEANKMHGWLSEQHGSYRSFIEGKEEFDVEEDYVRDENIVGPMIELIKMDDFRVRLRDKWGYHLDFEDDIVGCIIRFDENVMRYMADLVTSDASNIKDPYEMYMYMTNKESTKYFQNIIATFNIEPLSHIITVMHGMKRFYDNVLLPEGNKQYIALFQKKYFAFVGYYNRVGNLYMKVLDVPYATNTRSPKTQTYHFEGGKFIPNGFGSDAVCQRCHLPVKRDV